MLRRLWFPIASLTLFAVIVFSLVYYFSNPSKPTHIAPTVVGQACLTGHWTLVNEISDTPKAHLVGLANTKLDISSGNVATYDYSNSKPEAGRAENQAESVVLRGILIAQIQLPKTLLGQAPTIVITPTSNQVTMVVSLKGNVQPQVPLPDPGASTMTYTCAGDHLKLLPLDSTAPTSYTAIFNRSA
jgi:hypothetical protein